MARDESRQFDPVAGGRARRRDEAEVEFNRIVAFSDGVFAIAITLLVLGLLIPEHLHDLLEALTDQWTDLLAFAISFAVIGRFWLMHHRFFAALDRFDGTLMVLNLVYLACVTLVPFTSQVLGDYSEETAAVVLYALNLILVSLVFQGQLAYAYRRDLMRPEARAYERRYTGPANFLMAGVFALSIPVAFASTEAAEAMWLLLFVSGRRLADRLAGEST